MLTEGHPSATMASWASPRSIQISKTPGARLGCSLANHNLRTNDGVIVSSVSRSSPLHGLVFPGDRILACDGLTLSASEMAQTVIDQGNVNLTVASPLAVRAKVSSVLDAAKSITSRHAVAASQRALLAATAFQPVNAI